jgi:carbamoyltransferase
LGFFYGVDFIFIRKEFMAILGISEDFFDAGVTLCDNDQILFMSNEERYTRRKNEGGFPYLALESALKQTGLTWKDIEAVCVSGFVTPFPLFRRKKMPELSRDTPLHFIEHHEAHAWGSYFCSGFDTALIVTADGMGDGLSISVSVGERNRITRLWKSPAKSSFGLFFENLTEVLGFVPCRDEGKLTGLSAHGKAERIEETNPFFWEGDVLLYKGPYGKKLRKWLFQLLQKYSREDLCAWTQHLLEQTLCSLIR